MELSQRYRTVFRNKTWVDHVIGLLVLTLPYQLNELPGEFVILFRREPLNQLFLIYATPDQNRSDKNEHANHRNQKEMVFLVQSRRDL